VQTAARSRAAIAWSRPALVIFRLLVIFGVLAMHGTPAMPSQADDRAGTAEPIAAMSHSLPMRSAPSDVGPELESGFTDEDMADHVSAAPTGRHGNRSPAPHHLLRLCISDTFRSWHVPAAHLHAVDAPGITVIDYHPLSSGTTRTNPPARDPTPPDLHTLCISRT